MFYQDFGLTRGGLGLGYPMVGNPWAYGGLINQQNPFVPQFGLPYTNQVLGQQLPFVPQFGMPYTNPVIGGLNYGVSNPFSFTGNVPFNTLAHQGIHQTTGIQPGINCGWVPYNFQNQLNVPSTIQPCVIR